MNRINVGPSIRERRKELGMTLKDLSLKTGLSIAFISQVERGQTSPSLMSLFILSEQLEIDIHKLIKSRQQNKLFRTADDPQYIELDSPLKFIQLTNSKTDQSMGSYIIIVPPHHTSVAARGEGHDGEGLFYVLDGQVEANYQNNEFILRAGDSLHYDLQHTLALNNHTDKQAKLLWAGTVVLF